MQRLEHGTEAEFPSALPLKRDTLHWIVPLLIVLAALPAPSLAASDLSRDVLWAALKTCVLAKTLADRTLPCLDVDLGDRERPGTAVLRAPGEPTHIIVMPTDTVAGLEATVLRGARGTAYWRAALVARRFVRIR